MEKRKTKWRKGNRGDYNVIETNCEDKRRAY